MVERTGWDRRLSVVADGKRLVGHAGAVLLRRCADRTGLTDALARVLPSSTAAGWRERAGVLVHLAAAITLGAANLSEAEQLQLHHRPLFGPAASDSTARRMLAALDEAALVKIGQVRARVRRHVWGRLHLRPGGFPWLTVAGKRVTGWIVIDVDATIITAASKKAGAAVTFKKTFGFQCAMRRSGVSPAEPGGTWKEVPGPDDSPDPETVTEQEHVRKLAAVPRRYGRRARWPA
ncbi:transposase [Streptomyces sp. NPDC048496]|uniref:transposase n=1 Tax=Streptomyces sp. NPDC048496 TaxID=3365558 RepID=UPI003715C1C9